MTESDLPIFRREAAPKTPWRIEDARLSNRLMQFASHCGERGVQIEIHSYGGPLQRAVQQYLETQNVQLVMMRPNANWVADLLRKIGSVFRFLKSPVAPPVLLLHPTNIPER